MIGLAIAALLALAIAGGARAETGFVGVPAHAARVTDQAGMLTAQQRASLDGLLADYERRTGSQIAILLLPSTAPEAIEQYSIRVADAWKLGRKGVDDGVLLVVAKDNPSALRRLRIEAGRGVQGTLTDAQSKRVLQDVIAPRFRQGDFHGGLEAGINAISALLEKEHLPASSGSSPAGGLAGLAEAAGAGAIPASGGAANDGNMAAGDPGRAGGDTGGWSAGWLVPLLLFGVFVILPMLRGRARRGLHSGGWGSDASGVLIGAALGNVLSAAANRGGGSWGGGGGFSGGGGTFDGGGASGDW
ncbi:TPM domain-containing protein [Pseudoduganella violaceinigra]|uniref:TPM domain-containing protein n=1 Tax=Pseudoduganella violaceinigra TaxID=246602 RepID=UPI000488E8AA|nr:TPM domain-containing protein [Pseudoduganella violaceinigra]